jgi:DnaJ-class molecular chaperone
MPHGVIADGSGGLTALEEVCPACSGDGEIPARRVGNTTHSGGSCNDCYGRGTKATGDGQRLLAFIRRHGV